jgi:two-component system, sensor histidine kinase
VIAPTTKAQAAEPIGSAQDLQAQLVLRESPKTMLLGVVSAWLLAAGMWEGQRDPSYAVRAFGWAFAISLLLLRGVWIVKSRAADSASRPNGQIVRLRRNAFALAVLWGLSSVLLLPGAEFERQALLIVAIGLITMGGAVGRAVHVPQVQAYVLIMSSLFALGLLAMPGRFYLFVGLGYVLFGAVIVLFIRAQDNTVRRERELNLEIDQLLRKAEGARAEAETARQLAERASASKTRFLATASHDLRQPMHSIGLLIGLIHQTADDPRLQQLSAKAQQSIDAMERLFGSLLDISKLDAGSIQPDVGPVDFGALLEAIEHTWAPQAAEQGLHLRVRSTHHIVRSDSALLERIVNNLVSNAIRYTSHGSVLVACRRRGQQCTLQVWDTGMGIAPENQAAIFEEFYRVEGFGSGQGGGLGLGLSIVQRSAQILGHEVRVVSRLGRGSRFEVLMPRLQSPVLHLASLQSNPGTETTLAGTFVAILDDDEQNRNAMVEVFQAQGCPVVAGDSVDTLLAALQSHLRSPELIVADFRLGQSGTGTAAVQCVRQRCEEPIPALIVTADTDSSIAEQTACIDAKLLTKPVGAARLLQAAVEALAARPTSSRPPSSWVAVSPTQSAGRARTASMFCP